MSNTTSLHQYLLSHIHHNSQPPPPAIVVGLCKHGLYLVRLFSRHGIPVVALASDLTTPSARTRYGFKIACSDLCGPQLIETLNSLRHDMPAGAPIFATNDKIVDTLLAQYATLAPHFQLPFPAGDLVTRLKDKVELNQYAIAAGLPVPQSHSISTINELEQVRDSLHFPVAVKPTLPMSSFKSRRCDTYDALKTQVAASASLNEPLIVQEWIEGNDRTILFGAYYISRDGLCLAAYSGRKLLSYPPLTGHAAAAESFDIGFRLTEGARFLQQVGYWGLCSIEYKGQTPENARFIEVTVGRCDWWIMCCSINGVDIPIAAYNDLTKAHIPFANSQLSKFIWHDIDHSLLVLIENVIHKQWSLREALTFLVNPKKDAVFDLNDIRPFLYSLRHYPVEVAGKIISGCARVFKNYRDKLTINRTGS